MKSVSKVTLLIVLATGLTLSGSHVFARGGGGGAHPPEISHPAQINTSGTKASASGTKPTTGTKPKTQSKVLGNCYGTPGGGRKCHPVTEPVPTGGDRGPSHGGVDNPSLHPK